MHLVTGATGFIGKNLVPILAAERPIRILARRTSDLSFYRKQRGVEIAYADMEAGRGIEEALKGIEVVIHVAGRTMGRNRYDFYRSNVLGTKNLVSAMQKTGVGRLLFISSHAACGASPSRLGISEDIKPNPVSDYGWSKLQAETVVVRSGIPHIILRPSSVYGPYEMEILKYVRLVNRGICPQTGFGEKYLNLVYVRDLIGIIQKILIDNRFDNRIYFASDGRSYAFSEIIAAIARQLGKKRLLKLPVPLPLSLMYGILNDALIPEKKRVISRAKVREMAQKYWLCSNERMVRELGFRPSYDLEKGMTETVAWYRSNGFIPLEKNHR